MQTALAFEYGFFSQIHSGNNISGVLFKNVLRNIAADFQKRYVMLRESIFGITQRGRGNNVFVAFLPYFGKSAIRKCLIHNIIARTVYRSNMPCVRQFRMLRVFRKVIPHRVFILSENGYYRAFYHIRIGGQVKTVILVVLQTNVCKLYLTRVRYPLYFLRFFGYLYGFAAAHLGENIIKGNVIVFVLVLFRYIGTLRFSGFGFFNRKVGNFLKSVTVNIMRRSFPVTGNLDNISDGKRVTVKIIGNINIEFRVNIFECYAFFKSAAVYGFVIAALNGKSFLAELRQIGKTVIAHIVTVFKLQNCVSRLGKCEQLIKIILVTRVKVLGIGEKFPRRAAKSIHIHINGGLFAR